MSIKKDNHILHVSLYTLPISKSFRIDLKAKLFRSLPVHTPVVTSFMLLLARHSPLPLPFQEVESTFPEATVFHRSDVLKLLMLSHHSDTLIYTRNQSQHPMFFQIQLY